MSELDVSDVILDASVGGNSLTIVRRKEVMGANGRPTITTQNFTAVGAVYPTGDNSLVRSEAFSTQTNTVTVVTTFLLRGAGLDPLDGATYQGDIVQWEGDSYLVQSVNDFSRYGAGFIEAECVAINYQSAAPIDLNGALTRSFTDPV